jgi:hypothetical protein
MLGKYDDYGSDDAVPAAGEGILTTCMKSPASSGLGTSVSPERGVLWNLAQTVISDCAFA